MIDLNGFPLWFLNKGATIQSFNVGEQQQARIVVAFNRDHEGAKGDPENLAREDVVGTAHHVSEALRSQGFDVTTMGVTDDVGLAVSEIAAAAPQAVFNLCESFAGEGRFESVFPLLLDLNRLAFTGSAAPTLMLAVYKDRTKQILQAAGVSTPMALCVRGPVMPTGFVMPGPMIVKPSREDASVGIDNHSVVHTQQALDQQVQRIWERYQQPVLVEQYIEGREIYVAKLDDLDESGGSRILPLFEVDFSALPSDRAKVVTFEAKWACDSVDYLCTPTRPVQDLSDGVSERIEQVGRAAFEALDVRDYGRVDIRLAGDGTPYVIDVNPNCDVSPGAGFSKAMTAAGESYESFISHITRLALARHDADTIPFAQRSQGARKASRGSTRQSISPRGSDVRARTARGGS